MKNTTLIQMRKREGLTQREVADKAKVTVTGYQNYEAGLREPRVRIANRIAVALHSTALELFGT